ncbi:MAG: OmpH/Skp family outer membrane protein [Planctomycetota bacterium]|jgi:Skp family chaperone for outer membrane proteins
MKIRLIILSCLTIAIILSAGYEANSAESKGNKGPLKIGVISVQNIIKNCKKSENYRTEVATEYNKVKAELDKLAKEIEAETEGLKALKVGSDDYMALMKEVLIKQSSLQAQEKFYDQQMAFKNQGLIGQLYKEILDRTNKVAEQKGLDMVFENSEPVLPAPNSNELTLIINTHKLLYSGRCVDITDEVMAQVDASN